MNANKIHFRLLIEEDKLLYREIRLESLLKFPENFGTTYEEEFNKNSPTLENTLKYSDSSDFIFGAFDDFNLVGICRFTQEIKLKRLHEGLISQVYVMPSYKGQGIASALLKLSIGKAFHSSEIEQIILGVVDSNPAAISIYKKFGFRQYGIIKNYFKQGDEYWTQVFMILTKAEYREIQL